MLVNATASVSGGAVIGDETRVVSSSGGGAQTVRHKGSWTYGSDLRTPSLRVFDHADLCPPRRPREVKHTPHPRRLLPPQKHSLSTANR